MILSLILDPLTYVLKNPGGGLQKSLGRKIPAGKNEKLLLLVNIYFTNHLHEILSYLNKEMNLRIFEIARWEIYCMGKNPSGDRKKSLWGNISPKVFANPRGDCDLCRGIFSQSLSILSQKPIEFPLYGQYGLFYWK